jgi:hypothetical protein
MTDTNFRLTDKYRASSGPDRLNRYLDPPTDSDRCAPLRAEGVGANRPSVNGKSNRMPTAQDTLPGTTKASPFHTILD